MFSFAKIIENITGFIEGLNLTKRDMLSIIVVVLLVWAGLSANHYKSKANSLQAKLDLVNSEERIEKNEYKVAEGLKKIDELQKSIDNKDKELLGLYDELEGVRKMPDTKASIMEGLSDINDTEGACRDFANYGYNICN